MKVAEFLLAMKHDLLERLITGLKMKLMNTSKESWCERKFDSINVHWTNKWKVRWSKFTRTFRVCSKARRVHSGARSDMSNCPIAPTDVSRWRSGCRTARSGTPGRGPSERCDPRRAFGPNNIRLVRVLREATFTAPPPDL